jgi:hypothetical protein
MTYFTAHVKVLRNGYIVSFTAVELSDFLEKSDLVRSRGSKFILNQLE